MIVEFKVIRLEGKIVGIESSDSNYPSIPFSPPLATRKKIVVDKDKVPQDVAEKYYLSLKRQMM